MARRDLTDAQYTRLKPLLPSSEGKRSRPYIDHRRVINGILWIDRTGAPWRDLPGRYGPWQPCSDRLEGGGGRGVGGGVLKPLKGQAAAQGKLEGGLPRVDPPVVRPPQPAAGARHTPAKADLAAD